jgi:DNA repair exonuclease SbcCD ATPase subunit
MRFGHLATISTLGLALVAGACNRQPAEPRETATPADEAADRTADIQRERDADTARLNERVAELERKYAEGTSEIARGEKTATAGLREELKEDVTNVRRAVSDLATTTAANWWERHEQAMEQTADDVEADVRRLAGTIPSVPARTATGTTGDSASTAPFDSRRDTFVADLRARVAALEQALDGIKASGARETEVEDARARVKKLADDVDRLRAASADDWWDMTRARVTEYLDRVEGSVDRLDDNKP